jgi:Family of unknown function (DUF5994)
MVSTDAVAGPQACGLPARLELRPARTGPHLLDGEWRPRSADLGLELPPLVAALEDRWPGITRVTVSGPQWLRHPASVMAGGNEVHIRRLRSSRTPPTICLLSYGVGRCDLLITFAGHSA